MKEHWICDIVRMLDEHFCDYDEKTYEIVSFNKDTMVVKCNEWNHDIQLQISKLAWKINNFRCIEFVREESNTVHFDEQGKYRFECCKAPSMYVFDSKEKMEEFSKKRIEQLKDKPKCQLCKEKEQEYECEACKEKTCNSCTRVHKGKKFCKDCANAT